MRMEAGDTGIVGQKDRRKDEEQLEECTRSGR